MAKSASIRGGAGWSRRRFLAQSGAAAVLSPGVVSGGAVRARATAGASEARRRFGRELTGDVVICGGGLGGVAAALAACRNGLRVVLTEETDWLGGQLTSQGVPPDEHRWIEEFGATRTYRALREGIREYYRRHYPLTEAARGRWNLNPGNGAVSRLCHEPRVALAVIEGMLAVYAAGGRLTMLREHRPVGAEVDGDRVRAVRVRSDRTGMDRVLRAPWFVDATELGDLLPLTGTEWVTGAEGRAATGELHAPERKDPGNQQAFTVCFAIDHVAGQDHTIERPREYGFWREYVPSLTPPWPGRLLSWEYTHPRTLEPRRLGFSPVQDQDGPGLNLWVYRRIAAAANFLPGSYDGDISLINWPQNDYLLGNLVGVTPEAYAHHVERGRQLSLSLLYWMQTEAPRLDGGTGWPGLRLRGDLLGTEDGMAKAPYVREARRIRAVTTILEQHCGTQARAEALGRKESEVTSEVYFDSVGIGQYPIDLHPTSAGDNYIDFDALPFHVPLGALLPVRMENLLPAAKNIGTTHVTNGAYRLHPVEWNIGESVGSLVAFAMRKGEPARAVREKAPLLAEFQTWIRSQGIETHWPKGPW
ncbi:MAG: FAD-dependent oxidoreductase [Verrucomicrobiae bacterium]|nr:FAD-dependent oxidoreductase [Verrucomicrobiae bacterium]